MLATRYGSTSYLRALATTARATRARSPSPRLEFRSIRASIEAAAGSQTLSISGIAARAAASNESTAAGAAATAGSAGDRSEKHDRGGCGKDENNCSRGYRVYDRLERLRDSRTADHGVGEILPVPAHLHAPTSLAIPKWSHFSSLRGPSAKFVKRHSCAESTGRHSTIHINDPRPGHEYASGSPNFLSSPLRRTRAPSYRPRSWLSIEFRIYSFIMNYL